MKEISGRKSTAKSKLKASKEEERLELWKKHFSNLLGKSPVVTEQQIERVVDRQLNIKQGDFTMEELKVVLSSRRNGKAAGLGEIPPEVWKTGYFNDILLKLCNSEYISLGKTNGPSRKCK